MGSITPNLTSQFVGHQQPFQQKCHLSIPKRSHWTVTLLGFRSWAPKPLISGLMSYKPGLRRIITSGKRIYVWPFIGVLTPLILGRGPPCTTTFLPKFMGKKIDVGSHHSPWVFVETLSTGRISASSASRGWLEKMEERGSGIFLAVHHVVEMAPPLVPIKKARVADNTDSSKISHHFVEIKVKTRIALEFNNWLYISTRTVVGFGQQPWWELTATCSNLA